MGSASAERERAEGLAQRVTVGIVTALEEECAAMLAMLDRPVRWSAAGDGSGLAYHLGEICAYDGRVVALALADMGNNIAAVRGTLLLQHFDRASHLAGDETRAEAIADAVRLALQAQRARSLLVLDNVSEPGWASRLPAGEVRVLVTTRDEALAQGSPRRLEVLPPTQAREVADAIAGSARGEAEASAQRRVLEKDLGGLAVAVAMAARAVKTQFSGSWIRYERVLHEEMNRILTDPKLVGEYGRGVFAAIDLSIDKCDPDALALLEGATVFAPDAVPLAWALEAAGLESEGAKARSTATVKELGVVTLDEEASTVSLHRLVHRQVRSRAQRTERADAWREVSRRGAEAAAQWIEGAVVRNPTRAEMEAVDARREHLDAALDAADRVDSQPAWIAIANGLAMHLQNRARSDVALTLFRQALARAEQLMPPDLPQVATMLWNVAGTPSYLGDKTGAKPLLERALGINEATFGPEHPSLATALSRLASVLYDLGDAAGAKPLLERALAIAEAHLPPGHPDQRDYRESLDILMGKDCSNWHP